MIVKSRGSFLNVNYSILPTFTHMCYQILNAT